MPIMCFPNRESKYLQDVTLSMVLTLGSVVLFLRLVWKKFHIIMVCPDKIQTD